MFGIITATWFSNWVTCFSSFWILDSDHDGQQKKAKMRRKALWYTPSVYDFVVGDHHDHQCLHDHETVFLLTLFLSLEEDHRVPFDPNRWSSRECSDYSHGKRDGEKERKEELFPSIHDHHHHPPRRDESQLSQFVTHKGPKNFSCFSFNSFIRTHFSSSLLNILIALDSIWPLDTPHTHWLSVSVCVCIPLISLIIQSLKEWFCCAATSTSLESSLSLPNTSIVFSSQFNSSPLFELAWLSLTLLMEEKVFFHEWSNSAWGKLNESRRRRCRIEWRKSERIADSMHHHQLDHQLWEEGESGCSRIERERKWSREGGGGGWHTRRQSSSPWWWWGAGWKKGALKRCVVMITANDFKVMNKWSPFLSFSFSLFLSSSLDSFIDWWMDDHRSPSISSRRKRRRSRLIHFLCALLGYHLHKLIINWNHLRQIKSSSNWSFCESAKLSLPTLSLMPFLSSLQQRAMMKTAEGRKVEHDGRINSSRKLDSQNNPN